MTQTAEPIIIIGAPRSGTNMLRDVLADLPGLATWPCDEINYIWRHGNVRYPSDVFSGAMATPEVGAFIQRQFKAQERRSGGQRVIEKTCANTLRVGFVDAIFPKAKYVQIRRDGLDVIGSARLRWQAKLDLGYIAQKARFVPLTDLPYYGLRYAGNRLARMLNKDQQLAFWGPQLDGMSDLLAQYDLDEICALQWHACTFGASAALAEIDPARHISLDYETFVKNPAEELSKVTQFLGIDADESMLGLATKNVSAKNIGKGQASIDPERAAHLERFLAGLGVSGVSTHD